jgi:hypothetical protein
MEESQEIKEQLNEICTKVENALKIEREEKEEGKKIEDSDSQYEDIDDDDEEEDLNIIKEKKSGEEVKVDSPKVN